MRLTVLLLSLVLASTALGVLAAPAGLPGLSTLPDGSEVRVLRDELASVLASGTIKNKVLSLQATGGKLPPFERVKVWIGVPAGKSADLQSFSGSVAESGQDVLLELKDERVSMAQVMRDAYGVRLELRDLHK